MAREENSKDRDSNKSENVLILMDEGRSGVVASTKHTSDGELVTKPLCGNEGM